MCKWWLIINVCEQMSDYSQTKPAPWTSSRQTDSVCLFQRQRMCIKTTCTHELGRIFKYRIGTVSDNCNCDLNWLSNGNKQFCWRKCYQLVISKWEKTVEGFGDAKVVG